MLNVGDDLLSHTLTSAVPSALEGLASGFGMGPGVPHSATTTDNNIHLSTFFPHQQNTPPTRWTGMTRPNEWTWLCAQGHTVDANNLRVVGKPSAY